ncbi:hypothetical protein [Kutzneria kofuensis]|uniref:hypothetical protein n=1 Tax=Kutzneria kofuensis TaxID=103725 RepID=UPI0031E7977C
MKPTIVQAADFLAVCAGDVEIFRYVCRPEVSPFEGRSPTCTRCGHWRAMS